VTDIEKQIQDLLLAVTGMEKTQESVIASQKVTVDNVNKIVDTISTLSDVNTKIESMNKRVKDLERESESGIKPITLKNILSYALFCLVAFGTWITFFTFDTDKNISTHIAEYKSEIKNTNYEIKELKKKENNNKNQITYLKGSKLNKPTR